MNQFTVFKIHYIIKFSLFLTLLFLAFSLKAQHYKNNSKKVNPFLNSAYKGGEKAFYKKMNESLSFPDRDLKNKTRGTIIVTFDITRAGKIENIEFVNSLSSAFDELITEAILETKKNWLKNRLGAKVKFAMRIRCEIKGLPYLHGGNNYSGGRLVNVSLLKEIKLVGQLK